MISHHGSQVRAQHRDGAPDPVLDVRASHLSDRDSEPAHASVTEIQRTQEVVAPGGRRPTGGPRSWPNAWPTPPPGQRTSCKSPPSPAPHATEQSPHRDGSGSPRPTPAGVVPTAILPNAIATSTPSSNGRSLRYGRPTLPHEPTPTLTDSATKPSTASTPSGRPGSGPRTACASTACRKTTSLRCTSPTPGPPTRPASAAASAGARPLAAAVHPTQTTNSSSWRAIPTRCAG